MLIYPVDAVNGTPAVLSFLIKIFSFFCFISSSVATSKDFTDIDRRKRTIFAIKALYEKQKSFASLSSQRAPREKRQNYHRSGILSLLSTLITIMRFNWPRSAAFYINKSRVARNSLLNSFRFERQRNAINFESFSALLLCISIPFMQMISDSVLILKFACRKEDFSRPSMKIHDLERRAKLAATFTTRGDNH